MSDKLALRIARRAGVALLAIAALAAARAQGDDPLKSPACGEAIADLQSARAAQVAPAQVERLRAHAESICLGSTALRRRPPRVAQPPIAVPRPQIDVPARAAILAAPSVPPPPVAVPHFPAPAQCDPGGCWVNDGSHLQYVPPTVVTPRGPCTQQGALVYCP